MFDTGDIPNFCGLPMEGRYLNDVWEGGIRLIQLSRYDVPGSPLGVGTSTSYYVNGRAPCAYNDSLGFAQRRLPAAHRPQREDGDGRRQVLSRRPAQPQGPFAFNVHKCDAIHIHATLLVRL